MEEPSRKELFQILGAVGVALIVIVAGATAMALSDFRSHQELTSVGAGKYVSTTLNGSEGSSGAGVGIGLGGRPMVGTVSTDSNLMSLVQTDTQTLTVEGGFTDHFGDPLLVVTAQDDTRYLCPSTKKGCRKIVDARS
jgi:hypothetical protein